MSYLCREIFYIKQLKIAQYPERPVINCFQANNLNNSDVSYLRCR